LHCCRNVGIKTIFATGRGENSVCGVERVVPAGLFDGYILNNGALAVAGDDTVYNRFVLDEMIKPLLAVCEKMGLEHGFSRHGMETGKFWTFDCTPEISTLIEARLGDDLHLKVARDGLGQIMHKDATKANAVAALARHWNIAQSEIVAFGDDLNDIDLLNYAGVSVAVANALDEVKDVAKYICDTNENDGVAKWLAENVL
jgi:hydroxymethylpyrimidine pyrophosphatase-like HAD family hydrolase